MKTHWEIHPIALLFPPKTPEERAEMKADMVERVARGLDPLESSILLYDGKLLDGRHRDEIWCELAEEGAGDGYFARQRPPTETYSPAEYGTLTAWLRAKSRNMVVRQIPADQRGAIFLKAVQNHPELKAVIDKIEGDNLQRQKDGKPLDASDQRGNTAAQIAGLAGVGATTIKLVNKLQNEAPEKFEAVAQGKITAKTALKQFKEGSKEVQSALDDLIVGFLEKNQEGMTQAELVTEALKDGFESGSGNCANMVQRACTRLVKKNKLSRDDDDMRYHLVPPASAEENRQHIQDDSTEDASPTAPISIRTPGATPQRRLLDDSPNPDKPAPEASPIGDIYERWLTGRAQAEYLDVAYEALRVANEALARHQDDQRQEAKIIISQAYQEYQAVGKALEKCASKFNVTLKD